MDWIDGVSGVLDVLTLLFRGGVSFIGGLLHSRKVNTSFSRGSSFHGRFDPCKESELEQSMFITSS